MNQPVISDIKSALLLSEKAVKNNDFDKALDIISELKEHYPNHYLLYYDLGCIYLKQKEYQKSITEFEQALLLKSDEKKIIVMLGNAYYGAEDFDKALFYYKQIAKIFNIPEIHHSIAYIYHSKREYDLGEEYYRMSIALKPHKTEWLLDLIQLLLGRVVYLVTVKKAWVEEINILLEKALEQNNRSSLGRIYKLKGDLFKMTDQPCDAIQCYQMAIQEEFDLENTHANLSTILLALGRFAEAYDHSLWRFKLKKYKDIYDQFYSDLPIWNGEPDPGKLVVILPEQGVGDQILLIQLCRHILDMGMRVRCLIENRLKPIVERSFPEIEVVTYPSFDSADYQLYMVDMLSVLKIDINQYRNREPCYKSNPELTQYFTMKYEQFNPKLKVGIAWKSKSNSYGERKTVPLELWQPILTIPGIQFISIQYGDVESDIQSIQSLTGIDIYKDPEVDPMKDLESAYAQLDSLDLIISVSNAGAHMAASLGKPIWLLLSCAPLWHWFYGREDSIWYPDVTIFRQKELWDWSTVIDSVADNLSHVVTVKGEKGD